MTDTNTLPPTLASEEIIADRPGPTQPPHGGTIATRARSLPASLAVAAVAITVSIPVLVIVWSIVQPSPDVWGELWATRLPRMLRDTATLLVAVLVGTLVLGTSLAWLVTAYQFPGRRLLGWLLVTPLAIPGYVLGFVWLDTLQEPLGARAVRSIWLCALVLTLTLYPYVYLFARAAFREQSQRAVDVARSLGCSRLQAFWKVVLPMARPSLAGGAALVGMEVLTDVGTVRLFNVSTVADGVLRVWFGTGDRNAAAELSVVLIGLAIVLIAIERLGRGRARYTQGGARQGLAVHRLRGAGATAAAMAGWSVFTVTVALPVLRLLTWTQEARRTDQTATVAGDLGFHLLSSFRVAGVATLTCLALGLLLVAGLTRRRASGRALARLATLGYAVPGPVVAIGVLITLAALDRTDALPDGWLLVGSFAGLVYALVVRFLAVAYQGIESSVGKVSPSVIASARTLGAGRFRVATRIELPIAGAGIIAASVLVAIDTLKELPITLLLRPFGTETLPIWVWQATSESLWVQAAVPSLAIVAVGMVLVAALMWTLEHGAATSS
ncbi:ABC transporter permease [Jannaschia sp. R86511]|uniref:ABC transporter permease n=1 Tax=Jannaschia sp. R86511 TaxID=3093853 RepID=UPI0036D2E531